MANPIILHCFDEDYNVNEETVAKLFKNPKGVIDLAASKAKMFDMLSIMELDNEFMIKHLGRLDIPKLIVRRTLTNPVFENRLETIFDFIIDSKTGTLEERFNLIKLYMTQNMSSDEIEHRVLEFIYLLKTQVQIMSDKDEFDEYDENYLEMLYRTNALFVESFHGIFSDSNNEEIENSLFGSAAIIYLLTNENAPVLEEGDLVLCTEMDILHALQIKPDILTDKIYSKNLIKLLRLLSIQEL